MAMQADRRGAGTEAAVVFRVTVERMEVAAQEAAVKAVAAQAMAVTVVRAVLRVMVAARRSMRRSVRRLRKWCTWWPRSWSFRHTSFCMVEEVATVVLEEVARLVARVARVARVVTMVALGSIRDSRCSLQSLRICSSTDSCWWHTRQGTLQLRQRRQIESRGEERETPGAGTVRDGALLGCDRRCDDCESRCRILILSCSDLCSMLPVPQDCWTRWLLRSVRISSCHGARSLPCYRRSSPSTSGVASTAPEPPTHVRMVRLLGTKTGSVSLYLMGKRGAVSVQFFWRFRNFGRYRRRALGVKGVGGVLRAGVSAVTDGGVNV